DWGLGTGDWRLETGLETGDWRLETGDWGLGTIIASFRGRLDDLPIPPVAPRLVSSVLPDAWRGSDRRCSGGLGGRFVPDRAQRLERRPRRPSHRACRFWRHA